MNRKNETMNQIGKIDVALVECCMCGDSGLSGDLSRCKVCHFRSQHRYCSNLYPKAGTYEVCNWCLATQKEDTGNSLRKLAAQNSPDSNSSHNKAIESDQDDSHTNRSRKSISWKPSLHLQVGGNGNHNDKVKKADNPPEMSPTTTLRNRIITRGALEERLRRTKYEEMANRGSVRRQVSRNKVRRYKHLDEVSS